MACLPDTGMIILIIDDDPEHLHLLDRLLKNPKTYKASGGVPRMIKTFDDPADALAEFPAEGPVVVLCDYQMPGADGLDWLPDLTRQELGPVILLSSEGDERVAAEAFHSGAADYLVKGDIFKDPEKIGNSIRDSLRRHKLLIRNRQRSTDLKVANNTLEDQNQRLAELTETAHRFVDNVAHEFRTPLTVIKEFASIISDGLGGPVTDDQKTYLEHIDASVRDLSQMVDDFLDTSKLRAQRLRIDRGDFEIDALITSIRPSILSRAKSKNVRIEECLGEGLPCVFADKEKAGRALLNLVTNAIKFSPECGVVKLRAEVGDSGDVAISVVDSGPGLSDDDIAIITERFQQLGNQRNAGKGFGLGLNIARDLIRLNLGEMKVTSKLGEGSVFGFTLPYYEPEHIFKRYASMLDQPGLANSLSILSLENSFDHLSAEDFNEFLVSTCMSNDLVLPSPDGHRIVLAGLSSSPDAWIERLQTTWKNYQPTFDAPAQDQPLILRWAGTWLLSDHLEVVTRTVMNSLLEVRSCA